MSGSADGFRHPEAVAAVAQAVFCRLSSRALAPRVEQPTRTERQHPQGREPGVPGQGPTEVVAYMAHVEDLVVDQPFDDVDRPQPSKSSPTWNDQFGASND